MQKISKLWLVVLFCLALGFSQNSAQPSASDATQAPASVNSPEQTPKASYSGMYTFLQEGEFLQLTIEDSGDTKQKQNTKSVTGFVSRYGNTDGDRGAFLDQFIKQGALDGTAVSFSTETVHGTWYEFKGTFDRGAGKKAGDEGYYVLKGALSENSTDSNKKVSTKSRQVAFKSFPQDADAPQRKTD
jgi:hypothetical protein